MVVVVMMLLLLLSSIRIEGYCLVCNATAGSPFHPVGVFVGVVVLVVDAVE